MVYIPGIGSISTPGFVGSGGGSSSQSFDCGLRLTSVSDTPVLISTQLAKTTLYDTPHKSAQIGLYSGSAWVQYLVTEASLSTSGFTASRVHDIYGYVSGGVYTLEAVAWSNNTTQPTRAKQDGVTVKNGDATKRFRGCVYVNGSKEIEWRLGGLASGGVNSKLMIWNQDNRVKFDFTNGNSDNSWTQTGTNAFRQAAGASTYQVDFISGDAYQQFAAMYNNRPSFASGNASVAIGLDSTSSPAANSFIQNSAVSLTSLRAEFIDFVSAGLHYVCPLEFTLNATATWYGDNNVTYQQYGLVFKGDF